MNTDTEIKIVIKSEYSDKSAEGIVVRREFDQKIRARRAMRTGGILFGLAFLSIAVPILHFVLVPLFLIATPIGALMAYGIESQFVEARAKCPECQCDFKIAKGKPVFPYKDVCATCHRAVIIEPLQT